MTDTDGAQSGKVKLSRPGRTSAKLFRGHARAEALQEILEIRGVGPRKVFKVLRKKKR